MVLSTRAQSYIAGNDVMLAFSFLVVVTRFYIRLRHSRRRLWWDDLFVFLSLLFAVAFGTSVNVSIGNYGWDRHIWEIPPDMMSKSMRTFMIVKILFILASSSIRMSLLYFYLWLIRDSGSRGLRWTIYICSIVNALQCAVFCLVCIFVCSPVRAFWTYPAIEGARCFDDGVATQIMGAFLCLDDLVVNLLPLAIVAKLNVPLRQRLLVAGLLSVGGIATMAGIVREVWIYKALVATKDSTWEALPLWISADVELYVSLLCICAPALRPLYLQIHLKLHNMACFSRRRKDSGDTSSKLSDPEMGGVRRQYERDIWDGTFDGSLFSTATHICASRADSRIGGFGRPKLGAMSHSDTGIKVVTHIQLENTGAKTVR